MSPSERPYCRVYHEVMDDPKFDGIREDARLFGSWALLLLVADMAYPSPAFIPPAVPRAAFDRLVKAELVDALSGQRFRIHGLKSERERRSEIGRNGGRASAEARRNDRPTDVEPPLNVGSRTPATNVDIVRDETSKDETSSPARDGLPNLDRTVAGIWEQATGRSVIASGAKVAEYLDDVCRRHPRSEVGAAIIRARKGFDHIPDGFALVSGMRPILDPFVDPKTVAKREREAAEKQRRRRALEDTKRATHYAHTEPDPLCPACREAA